MTPKRLDALCDVHAEKVAFRFEEAQWLREGAVATGWDGRTYSELRREGYIRLPSSTTFLARLTDKGVSALLENGRAEKVGGIVKLKGDRP